MLNAITFILLFQVLGEVLTRAAGIPVPGPVMGMVLMLFTFIVRPSFIDVVRPTGGVLLSNLSLLFVPAGVGLMRHGERFLTEGMQIVLIVVISSVLAMLATAYAILGTQKLLARRNKETK